MNDIIYRRQYMPDQVDDLTTVADAIRTASIESPHSTTVDLPGVTINLKNHTYSNGRLMWDTDEGRGLLINGEAILTRPDRKMEAVRLQQFATLDEFAQWVLDFVDGWCNQSHDHMSMLASLAPKISELDAQVRALKERRRTLINEALADGAFSEAEIARAAGVTRGAVNQAKKR